MKTIKRKIKKILRKVSINYNDIHVMLDENNLKIKSLIDNSVSNITNNIKNENLMLKSEVESLKNQLTFINNKMIVMTDAYESSLKECTKKLEQLNYCNIELIGNSCSTCKKILIIGFYGAPNLGDELMLETLLDYLPNRESNIEITVMLCDNERYDVEKYGNIRFIHYPKTLYDFNKLAEKYDLFIFGGGAIIDDTNYKKENSYQYDLGTILVKMSIRAIAFEKKIIVLGVSCSENLTDETYINNLEHIINNSLMFSVRDKNSYKLLENKYGKVTAKKIEQVSDIILANKKLQKNIRVGDNNKSLENSLKLGIIWICTNDSIEKLNSIILFLDKYLKEKDISNFEINLIPFYSYLDNDSKFYGKIIADKFNNCKINIENAANNFDDIIQIMKKNDIIISSRYHGILLSYILNIRCIPVYYDIHQHYNNKIKYLTELFEDEEALKYSSLNYNEIVERICKLLDNKEEPNKYKRNLDLLEKSQSELKEMVAKYLN